MAVPLIPQAGAPPPGPALEDLFADVKPNMSTQAFDDHRSPMVYLTYYRRLFPYKQLFHWLNQDHVPNKNFTHREFALELQNEVYVRYNSFQNADEFKKEIVRQNPARFEIGPVYSGKPKDRKVLMKQNFKPVLRELVFDIDMTDYDSIRTCCQDKAMCKRCWRFISMAVRVLERTLREDFGFNHLLWVYSGRRGIHCWVSDPVACALSDEQRKAIVRYIEVIKGGEKMEKKVNLGPRPLHPSIDAALATLKADFANVILRDQDCFSRPEQWATVLALLPDKEAAARLHKSFADKPKASSAERWEAVLKASTAHTHEDKKLNAYKDGVQDIILQYTYPRIDTEVSKHLNHLLKSPFCIHPGTGRVCVPLLPSEVDAFDPDACPNVSQLLEELEQATREGDVTAGWERTSLRPFIETFEKHIEGLMKETRKEKRAQESMSMEF